MPQAFQSQEGTLGRWTTNAPDDYDWSGGEEDGYFPVTRLRQQYVDYLSAKALEYEEQKQARHYYHGSHWSPEEVEVLRKRRQPIITFNRINRKIDGIVGLVQRLRQDPKAYPTNPRYADGAEIATQCVRAVLEGSDWEFIDAFCAGQAATEGIGGVEFKLVPGDHDDPDVKMDFVFGDDFFYDPRSFKPDFSDARYMGIAKWLDVEAAVELFPDKEDELRTLMVETGFDLTTHSDREFKWVYVNEKRLRLVEHWYRHKGKWCWAFYCSMLLLDEGVSPFLDERNQPMNRFRMFSAAVDHDGDRYGFVRQFKGPQDETNQRRSKALFMSNVTRVKAQKGAVDNVEVARREMTRPDGWVEYNQGFTPPEEVDNNADLAQQLALMQDARQEIDSFANINPAMFARNGDPDDHSGVAINLLQKAGIAELGSFLRNYKAWKKGVYRDAWNIAKRTWQSERWIRVTNNDNVAQFLQINATEQDEFGAPVLVNAIGNLHVEMTMDDGPDEASLMQETYEVVKNDPTVPFLVKLEFMPIASSRKQRIQQIMQQPVDPMALQAKQLALRQADAEIQETEALAERHRAQSVSDAARAAHLVSEAGLNSQEAYHRALNVGQGLTQDGQLKPSPMQDFGPFGGGAPGQGGPPQPPAPAPHPMAPGGPPLGGGPAPGVNLAALRRFLPMAA
jgi:hypothetical protein